MLARQGGAIATWRVGSRITSIAYSPDSMFVGAGSDDGMIRIFDAHSGALLADPIKGHTGEIISISFSSDSTHGVSASLDGTVRLWDASSGTLLATPFESNSYTGRVLSVAFSPDGARIISVSNYCAIWEWDLQLGTPLAIPLKGHSQSITSAAISCDGSRVVSVCFDTMRICDATSGAVLAPLRGGHRHNITSVAFSSEGTIVSGSEDLVFCVWDQNGTKLAGPFKATEPGVWFPGRFSRETVSTVCIFSADCRRIIAAFKNNAIHIVDAQSGVMITRPLEGHTGQVRALALSPDGTRIVSGSLDGTIRLWNVLEDTLTVDKTDLIENVVSAAFSSDNTRIVSLSSNRYNYGATIRVWDLQKGTLLAGPFEADITEVTSAAFSPDGTRIVISGNLEFSLQVWDVIDGTLLHVVRPLGDGDHWVASVTFSPDSSRIAIGSSDCTVIMWDVQNGILLGSPFNGHEGCVTSVAFSPDGTRMVSGSEDCKIRVWDVCSGIPLTDPFGSGSRAITSVAFSPDGTFIVSGSKGGAIDVWDVRNNALSLRISTPSFEGYNTRITHVAVSADGTRLFSTCRSNMMWECDLRSSISLTHEFDMGAQPIRSATISRDGSRVAFIFGSTSSTGISTFENAFGALPGGTDSLLRVLKLLERDCLPTPILDEWCIDADGWVKSPSDQALLWLPTNLHKIFPQPPVTLNICREGSIITCWDNLLLGKPWQRCYDPSLNKFLEQS